MLLAFKHRILQHPWPDVLINAWTRSPWVHVEILLEDPPRRGWAVGARTNSNGVALSHTWAEALATDPPTRWEGYRVPVASERDVWEFLAPQMGKRFNYPAIFGAQGFGLPVNNRRGWFCSELAYAVCREFSTVVFPDVRPVWVHPGRLRDYCITAGCEPVSLTMNNTH